MSPALTHTDSVEEQDPHNTKDDKKPKSRRPANTAFRQQRLKAWQPILTPKTVLPLFFIMGIIFAPIGGLLIWASAQVEELIIDYSDCKSAPLGMNNAEDIPKGNIRSSFRTTEKTPDSLWWREDNVERELRSGVKHKTTVCSLTFDIPNDIGPPVYFYYRLTNFYQNHRRYVKSLDLEQLKGSARSKAAIGDSTCDPLRIDDETEKPYYPCGLIANSLFNDTFRSPVRVGVREDDDEEIYPMTNKGISWGSDRELYKPTEYKPDEVVPPQNWHDLYPDKYTDEFPPPNIQEWEEFQVWMRTAGLPTFSKLALRNDNETMVKGTYRVDIDYYFPVTLYGGTKSIVLTTRTVMGGKNPFLGIAYVVVGGICILLGALFTFAHLVRPRKLGDHRYLTWNNEEPSTATTTGRKSLFGFNRRS